MTQVTLLSKPTVELIDKMGGDHSIVRTARVSTGADESNNKTLQQLFDETDEAYALRKESQAKKDAGLINYLMREKHGSPFEHNAMTLYVKAPIFVFREFHRHRIGFSYNEMSGRYTQLLPEFWVPDEERPLINVGTSSRPEMAPGSDEQWEEVVKILGGNHQMAWDNYQKLLDMGIANEVSRVGLPVGIYSQMYVTTNLRAILNFISLRTHEPEAVHVSRPQKEIEDVARIIEGFVAEQFPIAYARYNDHGRVAP
ncbi:ThyX-like thymidylate synthase [Microbacterium phage Big4]|nr:ThyX-like thymidylate synthase [Microbacterium phage Big4]